MHETVRSNVIVNLIRTVTLTILSFLTFPWVTRVLGDQALGLYSWAVSFVYYFLIIARISIPNIAVREIVKVKEDPEKLSQKTHELFIIQAITTILSFVLMLIILFSVPEINEGDSKSIVLILALNFLMGVMSFEWIFEAFEKHTYLAVRTIIITAVVDILIFAFIRHPEHVVLYSFFCVLTTILTVISNLIYLPQLVKLQKPKELNLKQYLPLVGVMFAISVVVAIYDKTDSFILGFVDPSKASVGAYSVGMKLVEIVIGIITALSTIFIPRATKYYNDNDERQFKNINLYAANIALFITVPACIALASFQEIAPIISGLDGYGNSMKVLIQLSPIVMTYSLSYIIYTQILIPQKKEWLYLLVMAAGSIINIVLSLAFALKLAVNMPEVGVALATEITDIVILISLVVITWKNSKHLIFNLNNLKIVISAILAVLLSVYIFKDMYIYQSSVLSEQQLLNKLICEGLTSIVIYLFLTFVTKEKLISSFFRKNKNQ